MSDKAAAPARGEKARPRAGEHRETLLEEILNAVTHGVGAALAIAGLVVLIVLAAVEESAWAVIAVSIYGSTLIIAFLSSTLYHGIPNEKSRRVFLAFDHCAIFLLIAGTYTPVTLLALPGWKGWALFGLIWGLAVAGILLRLIWLRTLHPVLMVMYLVMGWLGVVFSGPLLEVLESGGLALIVAGGLCYTGGLAFLAWRRLPFNHAAWHLCVLGGSICHFFAVAEFVIPNVA